MFYGGVQLWNVFCHLYQMRSIFFLWLLIGVPVFGQTYFKDHFGGTIGISMSVGTHNASVGLLLNGYYTDHFYQINTGTRFIFYKKALGERRKSWESRSVVGLVLLAGNEDRLLDFELDGLNHQTQKNFGLGYNYIWYFDGQKSSQTSGGFGVHIHNLSMYHENDIFAGQGRDRFRTGQFHFSYQWDRFKIITGLQIWTGESRSAPLMQNPSKRDEKQYRDLRSTAFGRTSHGIIYGGLTGYFDFGQNATARIGVDSEKIRDLFQNKLIHDLGRFIRRPTPHYPMLDPNGFPTFDKDSARPIRPYLLLGTNGGWAY